MRFTILIALLTGLLLSTAVFSQNEPDLTEDVGTPDAGWYFTNPAGPSTEPLQIMYQTDFLWQLPLAPQRRKNWTPPTSQQPSVVEPIP